MYDTKYHATVLRVIYIFLHSSFKKFNSPCGLYHDLGHSWVLENHGNYNFHWFVSFEVILGVEKP